MTFGYNGLGRIGGQTGGPGAIPAGAGASAPLPPRTIFEEATASHLETEALAQHAFMPLTQAVRQMPFRVPSLHQLLAPASSSTPEAPPEYLPDGRASKPTPFGREPGPLRLLQEAIGGQDGWLLPLSLGGAIALLALLAGSWRRPSAERRLDRRDPKLAGLLVLGGWFAVEAVLLSLASGIVHPYYTSALGPGACAMVGAGLVAFLALLGRSAKWAWLLGVTVAATVLTQIVLLDRSAPYMQWLLPILIVSGLAAVAVAVLARRWARWSLAGLLAVLLIAPTGFAAATWGAPVDGTFPVAGPWGAAGWGGIGVPPQEVPVYHSLLRYLDRHHPTRRFSVLTVSSVTAAPLILQGSPAAALAGYSGTDPALTAGGLARLVARHEARYVLLGGAYASRGGNGATAATLKACRLIPARAWGGPPLSSGSLVLYDCAGRAPRLRAAR